MDDSLLLLVLPPLMLVPAMGLLSMVRSTHKIGQELKRKSFHVCVGLVSLSFPLILNEPWKAMTGMGLAIAWMSAVRILPCLQRHFGSVLQDCDRKSMGEVYFALSIGALILLTPDSPLLYIIPVLILTLADTAAAIFGRLIPSKPLTGFLRGKSVAKCAGAPGCRLVYWNVVAKRHRPTTLSHALDAKRTLATELHQRDKAFFYRDFVIEEVL